MKTIGKLLKDARARKRFSLAKLENETKIKKDFISALEEENWQGLPDFPVVVGFVKNIAGALGLKPESATALLRRDYPPQKLRINPKPDVSKQFIWSPKLTFIVGVAIVLVAIFGYLGYQYLNFIGAPKLNVDEPKEGQEVSTNILRISGKVSSDATLKVNNQPIIVNDEGYFSSELEIFSGTSEIVFEATSRSGKETQVRRKIIPRL